MFSAGGRFSRAINALDVKWRHIKSVWAECQHVCEAQVCINMSACVKHFLFVKLSPFTLIFMKITDHHGTTSKVKYCFTYQNIILSLIFTDR